MSSTPRAEQFEDRLKTIIHSVLAGDSDHREAAAAAKGNQDVKPPLHVLPYSSSSPPQSASSSKPMFSPVKKELPTHLPLPPSGIVGTDGSGCAASSLSRQQQPYYTTSSGQSVSQHGAASVSQVVIPSTHSHSSANLTINRHASQTGDVGSSLVKARGNTYYQQPSGAGVRPSSQGEISGLTSRTASDVISSEIEKSIGPALPSRSLDDPNVRGRDYSSYSPHINHEGSPSNHGPPKVAHSNPVTARMPASLVPGSSAAPTLPSRGGAPSMARMSQGKFPCIRTKIELAVHADFIPPFFNIMARL